MRYEDMIKIIAKTDKTVVDRGDIVVKDMSRLINDIMNYRYAVEHYKGDTEDVLTDKLMSVKNSMAILESDMDIYKETAEISSKVESKKIGRINKIMDKIS